MTIDETTNHESDDEVMVPVFSSSNHDGEMEAMTIRSILEASDIPCLMVGPQVLPSLEFQVQVSQENVAEAERLIAEARAAGPSAAAEAEAASEGTGSIDQL